MSQSMAQFKWGGRKKEKKKERKKKQVTAQMSKNIPEMQEIIPNWDMLFF